eukprot:1152023-Pelagomonas_calceolata.AAC.5
MFAVTTDLRGQAAFCIPMPRLHDVLPVSFPMLQLPVFEEVARGHAPDGYDVVVSSVGGWDYDKRNLQVIAQ